MKKAIPYVFASLFALLLLLPVLFLQRGENMVSELDNRVLAEAPVFGESGFQSGTEKYLSDRVGARSFMIRVYTQLHDAVFGQMVHPTYTYGKNGYVFFKMSNNVEYSSYHQHFAQALLEMQEYCQSRGAHFYFLFNPGKMSVYRRYLPAGVNYSDAWVNEFLSELDRLGVTYVSNSEYLRNLSETQQVFNRQYNAGHWNDLGCFYGMNNLFARIHEDFPSVHELTLDDFDVSTRLRTTLQVSDFPIHEEVPILTARTTYTNLTGLVRDQIRVHPSYRTIHYYLNEAPDAGLLPRVLIFQGSYLNSWTQFMFQNSSAELGIHNYQNVFDLPYYFQLFNPDLVVFEIAQYVFLDQYFSESSMLSLDFPPALLPVDSDGDALAAVSSLPELDVPMEAVLFPGNGVDTVRVCSAFGMRYAWLLTRDRVLDLTNSGNGFFEAAVLSDTLSPQRDAVLVIEDEASNRFQIPVSLRRAHEYSGEFALTGGAQNPADGILLFDTDKDGNTFSYVGLQLYDTVSGTYTTVNRGTKPDEVVSGCFIQTGTACDYQVNLRANSNLSDEYATCELHLEPMQSLWFTFTVDEFDGTHVAVSRYTLLY